MNKIDKNIKRLELVNQWISNCDMKSSFILTFYGVILTIVFTSHIGKDMVEVFSFRPSLVCDTDSVHKFCKLLLVIVFLLTALLACYHVFFTLKARVDPNEYKQNKLRKASNLFYQSISLKTFENFENESNSEDEAEFLNDLASQIYINAQIVTEKFKHYNQSLSYIAISLIAFILFVVIN